MRFVTYNIQYSKGRDGSHDLGRIADAVDGADVIFLQEVVRNVDGVPDRDQPSRLGDLLPRHYWVYGPCVDPGRQHLRRGRHGAQQAPTVRQHGALAVADPVFEAPAAPEGPHLRHRKRPEGSPGGDRRPPAGPLRVYSLHLGHINQRQRTIEIRNLLPLLFAVPGEGASFTGPDWLGCGQSPTPTDFVVMGDFNLKPDSAEYHEIVGEAYYFYGSSLAGDRLADTWTLAGNQITDGATWCDDRGDPDGGIKLDFGFVSPGLASKVTSVWVDTEAAGSDHQPIWFELAD